MYITESFPKFNINNVIMNNSILCNPKNYTATFGREIKYIVMHYTGNVKDNAVNNAKYYRDFNNANASAHYFVDDKYIYQSVALKNKAWHCGTNKTYYHNECRNSNSIGIEMCCTAGDYTPSETTINNSIQLCINLCKMLGITSNTVDKYIVRHYDVTHKLCPRPMAGENNIYWNRFKNEVKNYLSNNITMEEEEMSYETFKEYMNQYLTELANSPATWEEEAMNWGLSEGLLQGDNTNNLMPKKFITRGELMTVLKRKAEQE